MLKWHMHHHCSQHWLRSLFGESSFFETPVLTTWEEIPAKILINTAAALPSGLPD